VAVLNTAFDCYSVPTDERRAVGTVVAILLLIILWTRTDGGILDLRKR